MEDRVSWRKKNVFEQIAFRPFLRVFGGAVGHEVLGQGKKWPQKKFRKFFATRTPPRGQNRIQFGPI